MTKLSIGIALAVWACIVYRAAPSFAQGKPFTMFAGSSIDATKRLTPSSPRVAISGGSAASPGVAVTIQPGEDAYPGVSVKPDGATWDLSVFGHVEAHVVNTGAKPLTLTLRVDNGGDWHDSPWDAESATMAPGEAGDVTVIFGLSYGYKPGFALKPQSVVNLVLFAGKSDTVQSFRIESIAAGGVKGEKPAVGPNDMRVEPPLGVLFGPSLASGEAPTLVTQNGVMAFRPAIGRWDLRQFDAVSVTLRNKSAEPITPEMRIESNGGTSEVTRAAHPVRPGELTTLTASFWTKTVPDLAQPVTVRGLTSDAVSAIFVDNDGNRADSLDVELIRAVASEPQMPKWLGKRPPVEGDWVKTLDDEFLSGKLDTSVWNVAGENYYDKVSHWSKDNVILGGGAVKLRYEKRIGFQNDDPKRTASDYASGYLDTYGKWKQRYGYFEARMKLPTAPGLWPAFWMMPDRGGNADPQWKRQSTSDGGMEFDIMEHLTRWGPYRYNIAMHWDGYQKDHKTLGDDKIYVEPDKFGFITAGLLWTPGRVVYYCNGREVLRWENPRISTVPEMLIFTLPMGGWDNSPLEDAKLPDDLVIDYVRVWQRKDLVDGGEVKK